MFYTFKAKQVIEIEGTVEAETEDEARAIIENIYATEGEHGTIVFGNLDKLDDYDIDTLDAIDIDDICPDASEDW